MSRAALFIALLVSGAIAAPAAGSHPLAVAAPPGQALGPVDSAEFTRFVAEHFIAPLRQRKIGGAVLVAVRDGGEFFRITYGHRDVARRLPVDADRTMFVIASVSKTFTATAIAQLKSQGLLDYEDRVERRLSSFRLDSRFAHDLKIRHLLTHSTGIPDLFLGASCRSQRDCLPLAHFLQERQPQAHAAPGSFVSYSNFSNAVAGQIVADVSGRTYGDYLRERIFRPLGMRDTRYDVPGQPAADDPAAEQALGYELAADGALMRSPANYSMFYPAGQIAASGADMGRYLIAHLDGGAFLPDAERFDMQRIHARTPGFRDGYGWGWNARHAGDVVVIGHGGDLRGVVSDLVLVPAARFGYFVAITGDAGPVLEDFSQAFKAQYLSAQSHVDRPSPLPHPSPAAPYTPARGKLAGLTGVYQDFRFTHDDPLQLLSILSETRIRDGVSGGISVDLPQLVGGGTYRFVASGQDEFRVVAAPAGRPLTPDAKLRVLRDGQGAIRYFAFEDRGYDLTAEKLPFWRQTRFKLPALALLLLALLGATALASISLWRRSRSNARKLTDILAVTALVVACVLAAIFPIWVGTAFASASKWDLLYGLAALGLAPAYSLLPVAAALLAAAVILAGLAQGWSARLRATYLIAVVAGAGYLALLGANGQFSQVY